LKQLLNKIKFFKKQTKTKKMMTKNQKMLLGLGAVAVVGYFVYQNNKPKGFAGEKMNASGRGVFGRPTLDTLERPCTGANGGSSSDPKSPSGMCCHGQQEGTAIKCCKTGKYAEGTFNAGCAGGTGTTVSTLTVDRRGLGAYS
jgi:hypothetical protein